MPRQIRIDALADRCGVAPREVLRTLIELGHFRYTRFNQQVPEALAEQVAERLSPSQEVRAEPAASPDLFAMAMSAAGVTPLTKKGRPEGAKRGRSGPRGRGADKRVPTASPVGSVKVLSKAGSEEQASPRPEPPPSPTPVSSSPPGHGSPEGEHPPLAPSGDVEPELPTSSEEAGLSEQARRVPALEARVEQLEQELERAERSRREASSQAASLRRDRDELQRVAEGLAAGASQHAGERLVDLLQERGLRGADEAGFALRAMLAAHLFDGSLPFLHCQDGPRVLHLLQERLCLCCQAPGCEAPDGVETVKVPGQRCEICGGYELPDVLQRFSDACLLAGVNRVLWVGGRRWNHGIIGRGSDRRVQLRSWPGGGPGVAEPLDSDLDWARLAVLWDDGRLDEALAGRVREHFGAACVEVKAASVGGALRGGALAVDALDPAVLQWD